MLFGCSGAVFATRHSVRPRFLDIEHVLDVKKRYPLLEGDGCVCVCSPKWSGWMSDPDWKMVDATEEIESIQFSSGAGNSNLT
jgi:hypothetical protein